MKSGAVPLLHLSRLALPRHPHALFGQTALKRLLRGSLACSTLHI
jgi:hypothetical protein